MCNKNGMNSSFSLDGNYLEVFRGLPATSSNSYQQLITFFNLHKEESLASLPAIVSELAEAIGFSETLDFFRDNSAPKVHVQSDCRFFATMRLADKPDACRHIIKIADDDGYLYLPSAGGVYTGLKRAAIRIALEHQVCKRDIIRFFGISNRHFTTLRNKTRCRNIPANN